MPRQRVRKSKKVTRRPRAQEQGEQEQERPEVREDIRRTWWPEA